MHAQANIVPESILQMCIKVSNEPPSDMKSNMRRAFAAFSPEAEARLSNAAKRTAYRSILFGLCFYHSLLLGRKKFGTGIGMGSGSGLGFCRGYSFNTGDLLTCGDVLLNYLEAYEAIPWDDLRYMFGEVRRGLPGLGLGGMGARGVRVVVVGGLCKRGPEPARLLAA